MKTVLFITLLLIGNNAFAQLRITDPISREFVALINRKIDYEKFKSFAEHNSSRYQLSVDTAYGNYVRQAKKIKSNRNTYLAYINDALNKPDSVTGRGFYGYVDVQLPFDPNLYTISQLELYQVIKYYLFDLDQDIIPERVESIPFVKRDHFSPFKMQTRDDLESIG